MDREIWEHLYSPHHHTKIEIDVEDGYCWCLKINGKVVPARRFSINLDDHEHGEPITYNMDMYACWDVFSDRYTDEEDPVYSPRIGYSTGK